MERSAQLAELSDHCQHQRRHHHHNHNHHHRGKTSMSELGDDEYSTDSGCSSGGSTGSGEYLSCRDEWPRRSTRLKNRCYLERLRASGRSTRSQDRGYGVRRSSERVWIPEDVRSLPPRGGVSPSSYSSSPSDAHSGSDSDSLKRSSTTETLRRVFQNLKITSSKLNNANEKKYTKKSPKKILRSPVSYMYVRGLSGLPTQRVPRNNF